MRFLSLLFAIAVSGSVGCRWVGIGVDRSEAVNERNCESVKKIIVPSPDRKWLVTATLRRCGTADLKGLYTYVRMKSEYGQPDTEILIIGHNDKPHDVSLPAGSWDDQLNLTISDLSEDPITHYAALTNGVIVHLRCAPSSVGKVGPQAVPGIEPHMEREEFGYPAYMALKCP